MRLSHCGFPECAPFSYKNENRHWKRKHNSRPPRKWRCERWKCPECDVECARKTRSLHVKKHHSSNIPSDSISTDRISIPELLPPNLGADTTNATRLFVWTSGMDYTGIDQPSYFDDFTIPKPNLGGHTVSSQCPFFAHKNLSQLQKSLGYGFAFTIGGVSTLHQGVAMIQIMKFAHLRSVECHLLQSLTSERPPSFNFGPSDIWKGPYTDAWDVVFVLDYDNDLECAEKLGNLARLVQKWSNASMRCRLFPSIAEIEWHNSKVNDIVALDKIAEQAAEAGKDEHSYRPRTCYSYKKGLCTLQRRNTVLKASYSSQSKHVVDLRKEHHRSLQCRLTGDFPEAQPDDLDNRIFFHQEMISGFDKVGEFRALIATTPNSKGLRNREPIIESIIHLRYKGASARTPCFALTGCEAIWLEIAPLNIFKLREFALFVYESLRKRSDWREHFETLEVGVRLDIGVCLGSPPRFFVNEITRFQQGCWYSNSAAPPYLGFASAFARALNDYFPPFL